MAATALEGSYEGLAPFSYPAAEKPLQTYYRVYGDLRAGITPLVCIHGGPGLCHNYLLNHCYLTTTYSIPIILYDQIGSGLSTHLPETINKPELWTEEIFFAQLQQLLEYLKIEGKYDVLGSSWGGMMGSHFASKRPHGLRRLILANAPASKDLSMMNRRIFRKKLPKEMQAVLDRAEEKREWESKEVGVVMGEFARRHACTVYPFPEDLRASIRLSQEDRTVFTVMGDSLKDGNPFNSHGYFGNWTMEGKAKTINVPTLVLNGIDEFASGEAVKPFLEEIPDVRLVTLEGTSHSPHFERKEEYMKVVREFLTAP